MQQKDLAVVQISFMDILLYINFENRDVGKWILDATDA